MTRRLRLVALAFGTGLLLVGGLMLFAHRPPVKPPASAAIQTKQIEGAGREWCTHCQPPPRVPSPPEADGMQRFWQFELPGAASLSREELFTVVVYKQGGSSRCVVQLLKAGGAVEAGLVDSATNGPTLLGRELTSACAVRPVDLETRGQGSGSGVWSWRERVRQGYPASTFDVRQLRTSAVEDVVVVSEQRAPGTPLKEDTGIWGNYVLRSMAKPQDIEERWHTLHPGELTRELEALLQTRNGTLSTTERGR